MKPKGSPKTGGRKKGTPNTKTAAKIAAIEASGLMPLDFMLQAMRDELRQFAERFEAAKASAPYVHPKLSAIEHTGKDGGPMDMVWTVNVIGSARK